MISRHKLILYQHIILTEPIKTTITVTFVNVFSSENELPEEVQGKGVKELEKFILDNKERIENELIDFTESDDVEINTIKVEEVEE